MSRKTSLYPEDRERVDTLIRQAETDLDARQNGLGLKELATSAVVSVLQGHAASGDHWADRAIMALARDGLWERVSTVLSASRGLIAYNGQVVSVPTRVGTRARTADGQKQHHFQQKLWWTFTWQELEDWLIAQRAQQRHMWAILAAMERVQVLRAKYPDTATPGEAMEREGLDPRSLQLG